MVFETPTTKKETRPSLKEWVVRRAQGRGALFFLFLLSAAEAVFFPVPPEALLIPIVALKKKAKENVTEKHVRCSMRWIIPACVATVGSVVGGIIGFIIGAFFFDTWGTWILDMYHAHEAFNAVARVFQNNAFVAVFTAGFTPIPYKIFTLGAGVCAVSFPVFVIASIISRTVRFGLVGYVTNRLGMISGMSLPRMIAWITLGIVCIGLSLWFLFS